MKSLCWHPILVYSQKVLLILAICLAPYLLAAQQVNTQQSQSYAYLDSLTYIAYQKADWAAVISSGDLALELGYDYYYLQLRMGIAYFSLEQYRKAAKHFEKALAYNFNDAFLRQYLRNSYDWGGMPMEAAMLEKRFNENYRLVQSVQLKAGTSISGSKKAANELDLGGDANIYGEIDRPDGYHYGGLNIVASPTAGMRWLIGYSQLQLNKTQVFSIGEDELHTNDYQLSQHQVSTSLPIRLKHGLYLIPELDLFFIKSEPMGIRFDTVNNVFIQYKTKALMGNHVAGLKLMHQRPGSDVGFLLSQSNLNGQTQWQSSLIAAFYPFNNLNFYTYSRFSTLFQNQAIQLHFKQIIGFRANRFTWLQGGIHFGQLENAPDENAGLMYNATGRVVYNAMASVIFILNPDLKLQLDCFVLNHEDHYITFYDYTSYSINAYRYTNIHLKGGLIWKL